MHVLVLAKSSETSGVTEGELCTRSDLYKPVHLLYTFVQFKTGIKTMAYSFGQSAHLLANPN